MIDRTIFISSTGQFVTIGQGQATMTDVTRADIARQKLAGWLCTVEGDMHARKAVKLATVEVIGTPGDAGPAMAAFQATRRGAR